MFEVKRNRIDVSWRVLIRNFLYFRVWGLHIGSLKSTGYSTWRHMFIERPRVNFDGCYISKTSYLRYGERNFQDHFYRPVHLIEYYRYVRFFSDGTCLMITSADEPAQVVGKLKNRNAHRADLLKGHFRFTNDVVIIVLKKTLERSYTGKGRVREIESDSTTFCLQLKIGHAKKRHFSQLQWIHYSVRHNLSS